MLNRVAIPLLCLALSGLLVSCMPQTLDGSTGQDEDTELTRPLTEEEEVAQYNRDFIREKLLEIDISENDREPQLKGLFYILENFEMGRIEDIAIAPVSDGNGLAKEYSLVIRDEFGYTYEGRFDEFGGLSAFTSQREDSLLYSPPEHGF